MASADDLLAATYGDESVYDNVEEVCQDAFDERFYEAVLLQNPGNLIVLKRLVEAVSRQGVFERALTLNKQILTIDPSDSVAHYNMACSHSMLGDLDEGLRSLKRAVLHGYNDLAHLEADSDLEFLRSDLRYFDVIAAIVLPAVTN